MTKSEREEPKAETIVEQGDPDLAGSKSGVRTPTRKSVLMGIAASMGFVVANSVQSSASAAGTVGYAPTVYTPTWEPSTTYPLGQQVITPNNDVVRANVAHTSSATYATDVVNWTLSSTFALESPTNRHFVKSLPPSLTVYPAQRRPNFRVMYQSSNALYGIAQFGSWQVVKSTDFGMTWTAKGTLPSGATALMRVEATGTLLAVDIVTYLRAGTPCVRRSTDDGITWTVVQQLRFPTLTAQGIVETAGGALLVAEYGNVGGEIYRVLRSTDDGVTWAVVLSSPGGDPASDPGHFHSITVDPYNGNVVAFMDRANPDLYLSTNNGATWSLLGTSTAVTHPNWVMPMHFPNYIVWGTDNESNGRICRISRADFYAGRFDQAEAISIVNRKASYFTFPLRPDVWALCTSTEVIGASQEPDGPGSYASEVYLVSDDGATIASSFEHLNTGTVVGVLAGLRAFLPAFHHSTALTGHSGKTWLNINTVGAIASFSALPMTAGFGPAKTQGLIGTPMNPSGLQLFYPGWWYGSEGRGNGTAGETNNKTTATPFWVPTPTKIDKIACEVISGVSGAVVRLGIYNASEKDLPADVILDAGTVDASTLGVKEIFIIPVTLKPGLYFLAATPQGADVPMRTVGTGHIPPMPSTGFSGGGTGATAEPNCFCVSGITGAFGPWGNGIVIGSSAAKVMVRASV